MNSDCFEEIQFYINRSKMFLNFKIRCRRGVKIKVKVHPPTDFNAYVIHMRDDHVCKIFINKMKSDSD